MSEETKERLACLAVNAFDHMMTFVVVSAGVAAMAVWAAWGCGLLVD